MAGHFPFTGKGVRYGAARNTITAFFEQHKLNLELQELYYRWWFEWANRFVENDADLKVTMNLSFQHYPLGQHARHSFHLSDKMWAMALADLGDFIRDIIIPKLSDSQHQELEKQHHQMLEKLCADAKNNPRNPRPDVGYFRHI